ncbi:MAG: hypothetical protein GWM87_08915 [Xanthomonadales bacterium]|nr:hypothetical protein [Xanthomonadales bacterium]NIX13035.1 hypothetical protein [Xanthomonadales bacterium]
MTGLGLTFIRLLQLRAGPQDLPVSWVLTIAIVAVYLVQGMWTGFRLGDGDAAFKSLSITALQFTAVAVMLHARRYPERLPQTLAALAGTGIILGVLAFLFLIQADPGRNQPVMALFWFAIFAWSLVVDAHIYRNALAVTMAQGVLVAVMLMAASYVMIELLF